MGQTQLVSPFSDQPFIAPEAQTDFQSVVNFTVSSFWTVAEQCLGILCPCLVTFRPLLRPAARYVSSHLSSRKHSGGRGEQTRASRMSDSGNKREYEDFHRYLDGPAANSDDTDLEQQSVSKLVDNQQSFLQPQSPRKSGFLPFIGQKTHREKGTSSPPPDVPNTIAPFASTTQPADGIGIAQPTPAVQKNSNGNWRSNVGIAQTPNTNDAIALASLDPRARTHAQQDTFTGRGGTAGHVGGDDDDDEVTYHSTFGTKTEAKAVPAVSAPPQAADSDRERHLYPIEVQREFRLERE